MVYINQQRSTHLQESLEYHLQTQNIAWLTQFKFTLHYPTHTAADFH